MERTTSGTEPRLWQFILYRLFSLAGIFPIGGYLIVHLTTNMTVLDSPATFQKNVNMIHSLGFFLPFVEWAFIFLPILFHAVVGLLIISGAVVNVGSYPLQGNVRYTLQRVTGALALAFIIWHVMHMHHYGSLINKEELGKFDPHHAASSAAIAVAPILQKIFYVIGVTACGYHLANGIWTFGLRWGIWTSVKAMRRASFVCLFIGLAIIGEGMVALYSLSTLDIDKAKVTETKMYKSELESKGQTELTKDGGKH